MVFVASKDCSRFVQGSPAGELRLRVVGSARDGQIVELKSPKCAIGSARGCTLRLVARGVRPVHCLILRGTKGTVARSWAPNTEINGQVFRDSLLQVGDRLSIGPVEFEVLPAKGGPPPDPTDAGRTVVLDRRPAGSNPRRTPREGRPARDSRRRAQVRALIKEVRRLRSETDRLSMHPPRPLEQAPTEESTRELHEKLEVYKQQHELWETTLQDLHNELDSRQRQLTELATELESTRQSFTVERQQREADLDAMRGELAVERDACRRAKEATQSAQSAREQAKLAAESDLEELRRRLAQRESELAAAQDCQRNSAGQLRELELRAEGLDQRSLELDRLQTECRQAQVANQLVAEELTQARTDFEAQQAEAWRELERQRAEAAALELTHQEKLSEAQGRSESLVTAERELSERQAVLAEAEAHLRHERQKLAEERAAQRAALEQAGESLNRQTIELQELQGALAAQTASLHTAPSELSPDVSQELATRRAELDQQFEAFACQRSEWEAAFATRTEQFENAQRAFQIERHQFETERQCQEHDFQERVRDFEASQQQFVAKQAADVNATAEGTARERQLLDQQRTELEQARAELDRERETFEALRRESSDRFDEEAKRLELERQELAAERSDFEAHRQATPCRSEELTPTGDEHGLAEVDDSLTRGPARSSPAIEEAVCDDASDTETARYLPPVDDEESVEQYMAALLQRMRGGSSGTPNAPVATEGDCKANTNVPRSALAAAPTDPQPAEPEPESPVLELPAPPKELERRKSVEATTSLNVLREIGLTHARSAIETHGQQSSLRQAYGTLATSIFCFVAAVLVFYFGADRATNMTATSIVVIGIFWMGSSIWAVRKVVTSMRKKRSGLRSMMEEIEAEIALLEQERAEAERNGSQNG